MLASRSGSAQTASLVEDIAPGNGPNQGLVPEQMASFQGKVLFSATEPSSGRELWITDGTGTGTRMLADFFPGSNDSDPRPLGAIGSVFFGLAFHSTFCCGPSSQAYLWRSDGTRAGTSLLPDPLFRVYVPYYQPVGQPDAEPTLSLLLTNDAVYFQGCTDGGGCGLWRADAASGETREVRSFGSSGSGPDSLTAAGGHLFFWAGRQLWTSDGTDAGTRQLLEFQTLGPRYLTPFGNKVLFLGDAPAPGTGKELWASDGTAAGTKVLTGFEALNPFYQTHFLKPLGDRVYFVADDVTHGAELWASDGTAAGTQRLTDFGFHDPFIGPDSFSGGGLSAPSIERIGSRVVFWASDGISRFGPWSNAGTFASTVPLCPGCNFFDESVRYVHVGGQVLFRAEIGGEGNELWTSDGTPAGSRRLKDLCPGYCEGVASELVVLPGRVAFKGGTTSSSDERSLWVSDGTASGTRQFADREPVTSFGGFLPIAPLGGELVFGANTEGGANSSSQQALWAANGAPGGTRQVAENGLSGASAEIDQVVMAGGGAFFTAFSESGRRSVWRTNAGADGAEPSAPKFSDFGEISQLVEAGGKVYLVLAEDPQANRLLRVQHDGPAVVLAELAPRLHIFFPVAYQGNLFFVVAQDLNFGSCELWRSDGTPQGTSRVVNLPGLVGASYLRVIGSEIWFAAGDESTNLEIWRTNGTQAGTSRVTDTHFSRAYGDPEFTKVGANVYFVAKRNSGEDFDLQIWKSDGTPAGTSRVSDFPGLTSIRSEPAELTALGGKLYFFASLPATGRSLWRSDGTHAGTVRVHDFPLPVHLTFGNTPRYGLTAFGERLLFALDDGVHGHEPWSSDGTAAGTALLRDIWPGLGGSAVTGFTPAAGALYFAAHDGAHGFELWRSDGTGAGTRLVQDLAPEGASSFPAHLAASADRLFFSADDGLSGQELWALPLTGPACRPSGATLCLSGGRFQVEAIWHIPTGESGRGHAVPLTADTGYFWYFDPANVEAVLKVLDGRGTNGHYWTFYGALSNVQYALTVTDTQTGLARRYSNPQGQFASVGDTASFGPLGAYLKTSTGGTGRPLPASERWDPRAATGTCVPSAGRLCLNGGRFAVEAAWKDFAGHTGSGTAVGLTGDTGYFWFFDAANVEVVLKALDATAVNGHFWVFYGALSNVEYTLTVTDTLTGTVKTYRNPSGQFASVGDTAAF